MLRGNERSDQKRADSHDVIAGLDPAIHQAKKMDARVKPAHDDQIAAGAPGCFIGCAFANASSFMQVSTMRRTVG